MHLFKGLIRLIDWDINFRLHACGTQREGMEDGGLKEVTLGPYGPLPQGATNNIAPTDCSEDPFSLRRLDRRF